MPYITVPILNVPHIFRTVMQGKNMSETKRVLIETVIQMSDKRWSRGYFSSICNKTIRTAENDLLIALKAGRSMNEMKLALNNYKQKFNDVQRQIHTQGNTKAFIRGIDLSAGQPFSLEKVSKTGDESKKLITMEAEIYQQESGQFSDNNPSPSCISITPGASTDIPESICTGIKNVMEKSGYYYTKKDMCYGLAWTTLLACVRQGGLAYMKRMLYLKQITTVPLPGDDDKHQMYPFFDAVILSMADYKNMSGYKKGISYPGRQEVAFPGRVIGGHEPEYQVPVVKHAFIAECIPETFIQFLLQTREINKGIAFGVMIHYPCHTTSIGFDGIKWLATDHDSHYYTKTTSLLNTFLHGQSAHYKDGRIIAAMEIVAGSEHALNLTNNAPVINAKKSVFTPVALHLSLQYGDVNVTTDCITTIGQQEDNTETLIELLNCKNTNGTPGLYMAMQNNHPGSIICFIKESTAMIGRLFISKEEKAKWLCELLVSKRTNGVPALYTALERGHSEAITAFTDTSAAAIARLFLPEIKKIKCLCELLDSKRSDGTSGLYMSLQNGHSEAVTAFINTSVAATAVLDLSEARKTELLYGLLDSKRSDGTPGLYMSLQNGHSEAITAFIQASAAAINRLSLPEARKGKWLLELLACKAADTDGTPGFFMTLQNGHSEAITAFIQASAAAIAKLSLPEINKAKWLFELLSCKAVEADGTPGFFMVLQNGDPEAITAFIQASAAATDKFILSREEKAKWLCELLTSKRTDDGTPGFFILLQYGYSEAITAFIRESSIAIATLSVLETQKVKRLYELLASKKINGTPGFYITLAMGHTEAITAFIQASVTAIAVLQLPEKQKAKLLWELLSGKNANGLPGFFMTLQHSHTEAITAFIQASEAAFARLFLSGTEKAKWLYMLLASKRTDGTPGFCMTLQHGHTEAITAFIQASARVITSFSLPEEKKAEFLCELLACKMINGTPGFCMTLQQGDSEAITAFIDASAAAIAALSLLETEKAKLLRELLACKMIDGTPGFFLTLQEGYSENITAFIQASAAAIDKFSLSKTEKANWLCELLVSKMINGTPGFFVTLQNGHTEAIAAFIKTSAAAMSILSDSDEERAELLYPLLISKTSNGIPGFFMTLQECHADAITTFIQASTTTIAALSLPEERKTELLRELLTCKRNDGTPGFCVTLQKGHSEAITAFIKASAVVIATLLPEEKKVELLYELLTCKVPDGHDTPGFFMALQQDRSAAISAFIEASTEAVVALPIPKKQKIKLLYNLLISKRCDLPGFCMALNYGHFNTITAFIQSSEAMMDELSESEEEKAALLYGLFDSIKRDSKANFSLALMGGGLAVNRAFTEGIDQLPLSAEQKEALKRLTLLIQVLSLWEKISEM